jgi:hypothetical protein
MALNIIKGEDRYIVVILRDEDGAAYDLTGNSEIEACFVGESGTISKTKTAGQILLPSSEDCGKIRIKLEDSDTLNLTIGVQGFTITITEASGDLRKVNLSNTLKVEEPIC